MSKELKIFKYLTPNEYLEVEKKRFLAGYPNFKVNWNDFPNPEPKPESFFIAGVNFAEKANKIGVEE